MRDFGRAFTAMLGLFVLLGFVAGVIAGCIVMWWVV